MLHTVLTFFFFFACECLFVKKNDEMEDEVVN